MGRLDEKFAKAGGVVQRTEQHIEAGLDQLIAREDEVKLKTNQVMARQIAPLVDQMKALDALDRKLDLLSNGGPDGPLPGSGDSQDAVKLRPAISIPDESKLAPRAGAESAEGIPTRVADLVGEHKP